MGMVQKAVRKLKARYIEHGVNFAEDSEHLSTFLEQHTRPFKCVNKVEGIDGEGNAVSHQFKLHEEELDGQDSGGDLESCVSLAKLFAEDVIGRLLFRFCSLATLDGAKLFLPDAYPDGVAKRERVCAAWFASLRKLFSADTCNMPAKEVSGLPNSCKRKVMAESVAEAPKAVAEDEPVDDEARQRKKGKAHMVDSESDDEHGVDVRGTLALDSDFDTE
ncbi:unnamed protein product [Closterium sp. NIES-64]|nr:unnamed protein product [Closterium sp. NIES-64]